MDILNNISPPKKNDSTSLFYLQIKISRNKIAG